MYFYYLKKNYPQELEVGPRSGPYLLVMIYFPNIVVSFFNGSNAIHLKNFYILGDSTIFRDGLVIKTSHFTGWLPLLSH